MGVTDLPKRIEFIHLHEGTVHLRLDKRSAMETPHLEADGVRYPFTHTDDQLVGAEGEPITRPMPFNPSRLVDEVRTPSMIQAGVHVGLNQHANWALAGSDTLQLQFRERETKAEVFFNSRIVVPAGSNSIQFSAHLAIHRAEAEIALRRKFIDSGAEEVLIFAFDPSKIGGTSEEQYQQLQIALRDQPGAYELTLSARFVAFVGDEHYPDPYLFIANPRIQSSGKDHHDGSIQATGHFQNEGAWMKATIPTQAMPNGSKLEISAGTQRVPIYQAKAEQVTLDADFGHSLVLSASSRARYGFYLNGQFAFHAWIGDEETSVRIPAVHLTGATSLLSIRDASGTEIYLENYVSLPRVLTPVDVLQRSTPALFLGDLFAQAAHRFQSLKAHLSESRTVAEQAQLARCVTALEAGHDELQMEPLTFREVEAPDVSIIIPAHNKVNVTYSCLASLLVAHNTASFEVILVDDASTDDTASLENLVKGITVLRNVQPQRFIRACNAGAEEARGKYIALLNNDTEVTSGWLDSLIDAFEVFDDVGLVGSKLILPDGKLQEAGGIVWGSGNPWNYGNGQNPYAPEFSYARQVDYVSGAAMMTTREIWDHVDGLSHYLEPMYFEDTDFAFKVREAGYRTLFIPSSIVYHYGGLTSGTDITAGFKQYQEVNRPKFRRRWAAAVAGHGAEGIAPHLEKDRGIVGRVLFIDYTTPCPDQDAGGHAAFQEIRLVQSLGYKVTFFPVNLAHIGTPTEVLQNLGVEMIYAPRFLSLPEYLEAHGSDFDAFYITRYHVAENSLPHLRSAAPETPIILNNADLHFLRELRSGAAQNDPQKIENAKTIRTNELDVMQRCDVVLSYSEVELSVVETHIEGRIDILKCPWVVSVEDEVPSFDERDGLSFLGSFNHYPNIEGVKWFANEVVPELAKQAPEIGLSIYGSSMGEEIETLRSHTIDPIGFIPEIAGAFNPHRISVAPLLSGAGIKGKVLSALSHGIPCVLSPMAAEGIGLRHGYDCFIASSVDEWVDAILSLHGDPELWQKISQNSRDYADVAFSFANGRKAMRAVFEAIDLFGSIP